MDAKAIIEEVNFVKRNNSKICRNSIGDAIKCLNIPRTLIDCEITGQCPKLYRRYENPKTVLRELLKVEKALLRLQALIAPGLDKP